MNINIERLKENDMGKRRGGRGKKGGFGGGGGVEGRG
jgi:hypothetical protein